MATIEKFEDIICWQKARLLTKEIYKVTKGPGLKFKSLKYEDPGLCDQIQRASVSIMSNIAEGFERGTKLEFLNYLYIAKGSAGEVRAQLYVALDAEYLNLETFKSLNGLVVECSKLLHSLIESIKVSKFSGLQYKRERHKGMSETNRLLLENNPDLKELYNQEKDEIEFWRK